MITTSVASQENLTPDEIQHLYDIMIYAYEVTELEIWGPNYARMPFEEFMDVILNGQLLVCKLEDIPVGSIHVYDEGNGVYSFGLLSADFKHKGLGIGTSLVNAAESYAQKRGATAMTLEILRPSSIDVPFKKVLADWYSRMGYQFIESMRFEERKPHKAVKAKNLVNPSVFDCYRKEF